MDSLERLSASAALSEYFHLHEYGAEDHLLGMSSVGEWCDLVTQSLEATGTHLTFRTSGTTGPPKRCTHAVADLMVEVDVWAKLLGPVGHIVGLVPAHHIYGTIFTALLPDRVGADCAAGCFNGASAVSRGAPGTLVVGTPTMWAYVARALPSFPKGMTGVSSTEPLSGGLARQLASQEMDRLIEIYGSSETGGIGHRSDPAGAFVLLDHWRHEGDGILARAVGDGGRIAQAMMDDAEWIDDRRFALAGRRDGVVQVGGHNVFPERVRRRLIDHPGVADAAVRLDPATGRLQAFVVTTAAGAGGGLVEELDAWCAAGLKDAERPRRFSVDASLP